MAPAPAWTVLPLSSCVLLVLEVIGQQRQRQHEHGPLQRLRPRCSVPAAVPAAAGARHCDSHSGTSGRVPGVVDVAAVLGVGDGAAAVLAAVLVGGGAGRRSAAR